ncbi:MAG: hypothetical protein HeimC2_15350 [Candidatus Heimdallarchaeota archaeon LC_2]|nr:MAG: hypothetical protein HeimC2_15350 [Candidatus Heimdallarchaeota archaeon LC_2]
MTFWYVSNFSVNLPKEEMTGRCLPSPLTPQFTEVVSSIRAIFRLQLQLLCDLTI